ncbi:MAG: hypothetical protein J1F11_10215 [Oscillospiraceae bacterium]|nr:hypothetical protein [Oscillospiraceae bacterium]
MNRIHIKIISVALSVILVIKLLTVSAFAVVGPAIGAGTEAAFYALIGAILVSVCGYSSAEVSSMTMEQKQEAFRIFMLTNDMAKIVVTDPILDNLDEIVKSIPLGNNLTVGDIVYNWFQSNSDSMTSSPSIDYKGAGAVYKYYNFDGSFVIYYGEYGVFNSSPIEGQAFVLHGVFLQETYKSNGEFYWSQNLNTNISSGAYRSGTDFIYGDWRVGAEQVETDDPSDVVIGHTDDGKDVTLDMLNPDCTARVDGEDVPFDVDWDVFPPETIWDLIDKLLDALDDPADTDSSDLADSTIEAAGDIDLDIDELESLEVPKGIITVFPFCIPWDFVTGIKLLSSQPITPRFEIPFNIPEIGFFGGHDYSVVLDFSEYDSYFVIFRWLETIMFSISLCFISFKIVKGVG